MFKILKMPKSFIRKVNKLNYTLDNMAGIPKYVKLKPEDVTSDYEYNPILTMEVTPVGKKGIKAKIVGGKNGK